MTRLIKRYGNRKMYDTETSRYVTLDNVAELVRGGEDLRIVDNDSNEDLTAVTFAQIIFEEEKRQKNFISLGAMRQLIQSGGASLQELAQQAQARVRSVFRKGEGEQQRPGEADESTDPLRRTISATTPEPCASSWSAGRWPWKTGSTRSMTASTASSRACRPSQRWKRKSPACASESTS